MLFVAWVCAFFFVLFCFNEGGVGKRARGFRWTKYCETGSVI